MEVGRGDLAAAIIANRIGDPYLPGSFDIDRPTARLLVRAFRLGHESDPEGAPIGCGLPPTDRGHMGECLPGDDCPHCEWPEEWLR